jgi:hypothetical protein
MIGYTIFFTAAENYERQIETLTKKLNERGKE